MTPTTSVAAHFRYLWAHERSADSRDTRDKGHDNPEEENGSQSLGPESLLMYVVDTQLANILGRWLISPGGPA